MTIDINRVNRIRATLEREKLDAVLCARPANVLLLSGYCPVVSVSVSIVKADGRVALLVPEDEADLAQGGRADEVRTFKPMTLQSVQSTAEAIRDPLADLMRSIGLGRGRIGIETGAFTQPAPYAAVHLYGTALAHLLRATFPNAELLAADDLLARLRMVKTSQEIERIRAACRIAESAFRCGAAEMHCNLTEAETAARFRVHLFSGHPDLLERGRMDGFFFCMSGPNSYQASGAYQRSRGRRIEPGDLALCHCNSYVDGWWTDVTRTYVAGDANAERAREYDRMYEAIFAARAAALEVVRPGAQARDVDAAVRGVMKQHGYGEQFTTSTGHGVGFAAIDHNARPILHPASEDVLEAAMVFNVEPGIYWKEAPAGIGQMGMRHCDMVAVTDAGAEVLTPFHLTTGELFLGE